RDGEPAPGAVTTPTATTSRYALTAADVSAPAPPAVFQCIATAVNAGGAVIVESEERDTASPAPAFTAIGTPDFEPFLSAGNVPVVEQPGKATNGTVTLELELPGGVETYAFETKTIGSGLLPWDCDKVPASG